MSLDDTSFHLTEKQEAFVQAYLETGNATEAYRRAYNTTAKPNVINVKACEALKHPKIARRLTYLKGRVHGNVAAVIAKATNSIAGADVSAIVTLEGHSRRLQELAEKAEKDGKWAAAIAAEVKRGELAQLYVTRSENVNVNHDASDLSDSELAHLAGSGSGRTSPAQDRASEPDSVH